MELLSRVHALLRRPRRDEERARQAAEAARADVPAAVIADAASADVMDAGPIHLDAARYAVTVAGCEVRLTHKEFETLRFLMHNRGIVVSRSQLLDQVWGYEVAGETRRWTPTSNAAQKALRADAGRVAMKRCAAWAIA
ncbi:MAG: winged helix-turn-helix domain-containing protein, partial [Eggerthellaceae bacterium]